MNTGMKTLLSILDTKATTGLTALKEIQQVTEPFVTPKLFPALYLVPSATEKIKDSNDSTNEVLRHKYTIRMIFWISYKTTQEGSLIDSINGLLKLMEDAETLFESDMLGGILTNVDIYPSSYDLPEREIADGKFTRAGELLYIAETIPYRSTIHRT